MEHWQHDTFIVRWRDRGLNADAFLTFSLDPDGKIVHALMVPISPRTDFSFDFQDLRLAPVAQTHTRPYRHAVFRSAAPASAGALTPHAPRHTPPTRRCTPARRTSPPPIPPPP